MITKLRYVGVSKDDLLDIYILFIQSVTEYCSVVFHSRLTQHDSMKLERIQKTCPKVILGELYVDYPSALDLCGLVTLSERRERRCLDFAVKCLKHPRNKRIFPHNPSHNNRVRESEPLQVNFGRTDTYRDSAVPFCQRLLNQHNMK